jgi:DNA polymerase-1
MGAPVKTFRHTIGGAECDIFVPETHADLAGFAAFLSRGDRPICVDTETTGLDIYSREHRLRLVQFGDDREAWVLRADLFADVAADALRRPLRLTAHNATYDALVLDRHGVARLEDLMPRMTDTRILAHLLDPRAKQEGGLGLRLKDLAAVYVDPSAPDTEEGLTAVFRSLGLTKATGFARIPIDHPTYLTYAGLDTILGARLLDELAPMVSGIGCDDLSEFEHHLQMLLAILQRRGMLLDVPYAEDLLAGLRAEGASHRAAAKALGLDNVSSPRQVADRLLAMGEVLTERTASGAYKVDRAVLSALADLDRQLQPIGSREPNPVALAVVHAKRADKWASTYAQALLDLRDEADRVHPSIGALMARTARMSISNPPLQQLPSSDWTIRRAFIADPGQVIIAADYQAVEMRVLAALSGDATMRRAIAAGEDLHSFTAERVFGEGFTSQHRKIAKAVGFGKVYGGGAATISRQTGADPSAVRAAIDAYDATFPGIKRYARHLQRAAEFGKREVVTPSGRHLPLDRDRLYAATNYVVQSTARDLLAQAIVDIFDAGLGDHLLIPVHDELIGQAPEADAKEVITEIGRVMESTFHGVHIASDPEVYGPSWGHGYGAP